MIFSTVIWSYVTSFLNWHQKDKWNSLQGSRALHNIGKAIAIKSFFVSVKFFVLLKVYNCKVKRELRFICNRIQVIEVRKSRFVRMRILSLELQKKFHHWILFCVSFANNLASSDYWNLYRIIRLGTLWSHYWDEITDRITKCLSDVLVSYQWEIDFCYRGSKILRDLIRNLQ